MQLVLPMSRRWQIFSDVELPPMPDLSKLQAPLSEFSRPSDSSSASVPPPPQQVLRFEAPVFQPALRDPIQMPTVGRSLKVVSARCWQVLGSTG